MKDALRYAQMLRETGKRCSVRRKKRCEQHISGSASIFRRSEVVSMGRNSPEHREKEGEKREKQGEITHLFETNEKVLYMDPLKPNLGGPNLCLLLPGE